MTLDELDRLRAEHERQNQTVLRLDGRRYPDRHEYLHNAWPAISARLRAAEARARMDEELIQRLGPMVLAAEAVLRAIVACDDALNRGDEPPLSLAEVAAAARAALGEL